MLLSGWGGALADRYDRRRLAIVLSVVQAALAGTLAVAEWADGASVALIFAISLGIGIAGSIANPALQTTIPSLVPPDLRADAISVNSSVYNVARLVGPAVGGVLVTAAGAGACFAVNAASFLVVVALMHRVPLSEQVKRKPSVRGAFGYAWSRATVRELLLAIGAFLLLASSVQRLSPVIADRAGAGAHGNGMLLSALALGGIVGAALVVQLQDRGHPRSRLIPLGGLGFAAVIAVVALPLPFAVTVAVAAVGGVCWEVVWVSASAGVQLGADDDHEGQVVGLFFQTTSGAQALGPLAVGVVGDAIGLQGSLLLCAAGLGLLATGAVVRPRAPFDAQVQ